jgi:hypothetical protein
MASWTEDELQRIANSDDLHISPLREDGVTYGTPTWIWSVVVDGNLYVRGYNGQKSRWYQAAVRQSSGRIRAAGMTKQVALNSPRTRSMTLFSRQNPYCRRSSACVCRLCRSKSRVRAGLTEALLVADVMRTERCERHQTGLAA